MKIISVVSDLLHAAREIWWR